MARAATTNVRHPGKGDATRRARLLSAGVAAPTVSAILVMTAAGADEPLGAPPYWPWLLTGLQVLGLWAAGSGRWWGWLLGGAVQVPWIAYAVVTGQIGFIPGCAVSAAVQIHSFLADRPPAAQSRRTHRRVRVYA